MSLRSLPLAIAILLVPCAARAADPAAAQALFDEGKELIGQGRYEEACPKLAASEKLDPGIGTEFHLADCFQRMGRTASAWAMFRQVESEASATGQQGRMRVAQDRASALEPMLSKLAIDAGAAANTPGLTIMRDGVPVSRELWGVPVPVDPGRHAVEVDAPGKLPWQTPVDVSPGGNVAHLEVPLLADMPAPVVSVVPPPAGRIPSMTFPARGIAQPMPPSNETPVLDNRGSGMRAVGWFFVGAGLVGLGTAGYFGAKWLEYKDSSDPSEVSSAMTHRDYAAIAGGAGIGGIILGTVLVAAAPSPRVLSTTTAGLTITPTAGPNAGGVSLRGAW